MSGTPIEHEAPPRRVTSPLVVLGCVLWVLALCVLGLRGLAENEGPGRRAYLDHVAQAQFWLATGGLICAWLARIWARQGHARHATVAASVSPLLFVAAILVLVTA